MFNKLLTKLFDLWFERKTLFHTKNEAERYFAVKNRWLHNATNAIADMCSYSGVGYRSLMGFTDYQLLWSVRDDIHKTICVKDRKRYEPVVHCEWCKNLSTAISKLQKGADLPK